MPLEANEEDREKFTKKKRNREKTISKSYILVMLLDMHWKTVGHDSNTKTHNDTNLFIKIGWSSCLKMVIFSLTSENTLLYLV